MGVPVDHIQARVAAKALAKEHSKLLDDALHASLGAIDFRSRWDWFRRSTKRFYKTHAVQGRGILWTHHETRKRGRRSATVALGYLETVDGRLHGLLEILHFTGNADVETIGNSMVTVSQHAAEAMFRKANRLDRHGVVVDLLQAISSLFVSITDSAYWQPGYCELEILTENGLAFAVRDPGEPVYTITTWVPEHQLRPDQRRGWTLLDGRRQSGMLVAVMPRALPRLSASIHRQGLEGQRFTSK